MRERFGGLLGRGEDSSASRAMGGISGRWPFPQSHARCKHLRVTLLHDPSLLVVLRTLPARNQILAFNQTKNPTFGRVFSLAEREGFEPSREIAPPYRFSKPTPSATWVPLRFASTEANTRILYLLSHLDGRGWECKFLCMIAFSFCPPGKQHKWQGHNLN